MLIVFLFVTISTNLFAQHKVEITIKGIEEFKGTVLVAVYNSEASFMKKHFTSQKVKATGNQVTLVLQDLSPGEYAISTFHDENDDEKLNTNLVGIPKELYGFSNDAKGSFGPPSFEKAKIKIEGDKKIVINLR